MSIDYSKEFIKRMMAFERQVLQPQNGSAAPEVSSSQNSAGLPQYFSGKKILDVGAGSGRFMGMAKQFGAEVWGVDYNRHVLPHIKEAVGLDAEDIDNRVFIMSFSEFSQRHQELRRSFDVVKITAVTPYADAGETRKMIGCANRLLKKDGYLLIELPWEIETKMYQENQDLREIQKRQEAKSSARRSANTWTKPNNAVNLQNAYMRLIGLHFQGVFDYKSEIPSDAPYVFATLPRDIIPQVKDLDLNLSTGTLTLKGEARQMAMQLEKGKKSSYL